MCHRCNVYRVHKYKSCPACGTQFTAKIVGRIHIENVKTGARWSSVNGDVWRKEWNGTGDNYISAGSVDPRFKPFSKRNRDKFQILNA